MPLKRIIIIVFLFSLLAGCTLVEGTAKHLRPLSPQTIAKLKAIGSSPSEAILIRIFKEESVLELWKRRADGTYKLFKTYDICRWSGLLGPKFKEGDKQAPEGFYTVTPGRMNPNSSYYLSFDTGFPNKFDRAHGRTGSNLMIHGDCSSAGCYAMTDEQIAEIYALARDSFRGGQKSFQLQLYPFRLTPKNLARYRKSEHIEFWKNLKIGYDAFELSKKMPQWDICEGKYIFNAVGSGSLDAFGKCPKDSTMPQLMARVKAKQISDMVEFEKIVAELEKKEAEAILLAEKKAQQRAQAMKRSAAINEAINQQTAGISAAIEGFFGNLFGINSVDNTKPANIDAPIPAPRINR